MNALARIAVALVALVTLATGGALAQALSSTEQTEIHKVIQTHLDALKRSDFEAAYAVAAPSLKALYPTAQAYSGLVKNRYAQLLSPKAIVFGTVMQTSQGPVQRVFVTSADGMAYIANYSMQKQPDSTWLISGTTVARDRGSSAI